MSIDYNGLAAELKALLGDEQDWLANAANTCALIYQRVDRLNWAGFYFLQGDELVLGPFQGKPACVRIPLGQGVCGTAAAERKTQLVEDVHQFPGHIACDAASNAEIVVPLISADRLVGVLDLDSPHIGRFTESDRDGIEHLAGIFVEASELTGRGRLL